MQNQSEPKHHYVIDASKPWHLAWWADQLGVPEDALVEAILRVGVDADAVEEFLASRNQLRRAH